MREKIARWLREYKLNEVEVDNPEAEDGIIKWDKASGATKGYWLKDADQILALIAEEIEKVRENNPYPAKPKLASAEYYEANGYDRACRRILALLKGKPKPKNVIGSVEL